jgi:hypothetical protein
VTDGGHNLGRVKAELPAGARVADHPAVGYDEQVRPDGAGKMPGVLFSGLRVMALDGSTLEMPDETANAEHFGYPGVSRGEPAFP